MEGAEAMSVEGATGVGQPTPLGAARSGAMHASSFHSVAPSRTGTGDLNLLAVATLPLVLPASPLGLQLLPLERVAFPAITNGTITQSRRLWRLGLWRLRWLGPLRLGMGRILGGYWPWYAGLGLGWGYPYYYGYSYRDVGSYYSITIRHPVIT